MSIGPVASLISSLRAPVDVLRWDVLRCVVVRCVVVRGVVSTIGNPLRLECGGFFQAIPVAAPA
jgi:hypothetical protein